MSKKNILFLGNRKNSVYSFLEETENLKYVDSDTVINLDFVSENNFDYIVSYGYRKIISEDIVKNYRNKIINLHISYLPFNRGAFPNVWSFIDNTPKGVTIHYIDENIDTGPILLQKVVHFDNIDEETFRSTYDKLSREIENLFINNWNNIKHENITPIEQILDDGSTHTINQSLKMFEEIGLKQNWDEKVGKYVTFRRTDNDIIDDIQNIRTQNNTHWMDVVRLAFRESPEEARSIFKKIKFCDHKVNELLKELSNNE